eukprot:28550-Pelagococcus_subviridis.AAC.4
MDVGLLKQSGGQRRVHRGLHGAHGFGGDDASSKRRSVRRPVRARARDRLRLARLRRRRALRRLGLLPELSRGLVRPPHVVVLALATGVVAHSSGAVVVVVRVVLPHPAAAAAAAAAASGWLRAPVPVAARAARERAVA